MRRAFGGAILVAAGIAALIEAHRYRPEYDCTGKVAGCEHGENLHLVPGHLTESPYDLLSSGAWALVILGGVLLIVGLMGLWRDSRTAR